MTRSITFLSFAFFLLAIPSLFAQSPTRPNALIFKRIVTDYHAPSTGEFTEFENYRGGFEVAYLRNLSRRVSAAIPAKVGVINLPGESENRTIVSIDGLIHLQYFEFKNRLIPYFLAGAGAVFEEDADMNIQIPIGLGFHVRLGQYAYINAQSEFRKSLSADRDNLQHGLGLGFMLGKTTEQIDSSQLFGTDLDGDGIKNENDNCPEVPGLIAFNGCPDTDSDGIEDSKDECPKLPGTLALKGCPDTDGDGVIDPKDDCPEVVGKVNGCPDDDDDGLANAEDKCPNQAGPISNEGCPETDTDGDGVPDKADDCPEVAGQVNGCPDADGDGIADKEDRCPKLAGPLNAQGCPDTDKDGLHDDQDRCPNSAGPASNNGCPEIRQEDKATLQYAIQAVQFETGKDQLKPASYAILDQVYQILQRYPDYKLIISGHTDDRGTEENNQILSSNRAQSCYDYLRTKGIDLSRLSYIGYGESRPISDNGNSTGRQLNRRVEFDLVPR